MDNSKDNSVKVAVRIRPLNDMEVNSGDETRCVDTIPGGNQIVAGSDISFTFDHVFDTSTKQSAIFDECVKTLLDAAFEGFNATIIAYGQTGSGKTFTMGSSTDMRMTSESMGIIPRVIQLLFDTILAKESNDQNISYKVHVQFLEIYGEDIRDLLDRTRTSKVTIRETVNGEVFVSGAREEVVSSTAQMMRTLEEGTKHRTTASTCMNNESSRSHAIFTIILEETIQSTVLNSELYEFESLGDETSAGEGTPRKSRASIGIAQSAPEVRRSKFHFVDLAGSERLKRTKAQGVQLKEGIDINKGLLALGNVISALGDEQKRGKVHVPYRDSKLTRILQDSLGGNSKTLFICCVSPAMMNFHESINSLKYANRARNIKNKPIINRDPTLVVIDELKDLVQGLARELLVYKHSDSSSENDKFSLDILQDLAKISLSSKDSKTRLESIPEMSNQNEGNKLNFLSNSSVASNKDRSINATLTREVNSLKSKVAESDFEIRRLSELVKTLRLETSDLTDRVLLAESEKDFYRIKSGHGLKDVERELGNPLASGDNINENGADNKSVLSTTAINEKKEFVDSLLAYRQENERLKAQLSALQESKSFSSSSSDSFHGVGESLENELTTSVARVIAQTKEQLLTEAKRLEKVAEECGLQKSGLQAFTNAMDGDDEENEEMKLNLETDANNEEESFQMRQKTLTSQLQELGESIILKENLVIQLKKSQEQYSLMKAFYEQKLTTLQQEVDEKQQERELLLSELLELSKSKILSTHQISQETKLKEELKRKDNELQQLKRRQEELSNLSQVQTRYMQQLAKMEHDIEAMKKQKVDLTKLLQNEKKRHISALHEKVKEVERLKRELQKTTGEIKKLNMEKTRAEDRAKEIMRENSLRKRKPESVKFDGTSGLSNSNLNAGSVSTNRNSNRSLAKLNGLKFSVPAPRFLTQDELKTKKWLVGSINKLIAREASIESLGKQHDQQSTLLSKREELEISRANLETNLDTNDRDEILADLDEKIISINQQVKLRNQNIQKSQALLEQGEDIAEIYEKTIDSMKRNISINLLRLLFEMLVKSYKSSSMFKDLLDRAQVKEKSLLLDVESNNLKLSKLRAQHENEITQVKQEYEEKLQGLIENSSVTRVLMAECASATNGSTKAPNEPTILLEEFNTDAVHSADSYKMVIAMLSDKCNNLKQRLIEEQERCDLFKKETGQYSHEVKLLQHELEDSEYTIEFLENERELFREMVNDLKAGIMSFGGNTGQLIINQIREKASEKEKDSILRNPQSFLRSSKIVDDGDVTGGADDDNESVMTEFNDLMDEINRTGNLSKAKGGVVYDRLTNPLNFTGSMKNVFEKDLAVKRQKVQKIKNQTQSHPFPRTTFADVSDDFNISVSSSSSSTATSAMLSAPVTKRGSATTTASGVSSSTTRNPFDFSSTDTKENSHLDGNIEHPHRQQSPLSVDILHSENEIGQRKRVDSDASLEISTDVAVGDDEKPGSPTRRKSNDRAISITDRLHQVMTQSVRSKQLK